MSNVHELVLCAIGEGGVRQEDFHDAGVLSSGCKSAHVRNVCVAMLSAMSVLAERESWSRRLS